MPVLIRHRAAGMTTAQYDEISPPIVAQLKKAPGFLLHVTYEDPRASSWARSGRRKSSTTPGSTRTWYRTSLPRSHKKWSACTASTRPRPHQGPRKVPAGWADVGAAPILPRRDHRSYERRLRGVKALERRGADTASEGAEKFTPASVISARPSYGKRGRISPTACFLSAYRLITAW